MKVFKILLWVWLTISKQYLILSLLNCMAFVPVCQHGLCTNIFVCQHGLCGNVLACQHAKSVQTSHFYVPINVVTCYKKFQCLNMMCYHAKRHANFSDILWNANVLWRIMKCQGNFLYSIIMQKILHYTWYHSYTYHMYMYCT